MKPEKLALTLLGLVVVGWVVRMGLGVIALARHQDVSGLGIVAFEFAMFLGAGLIPVVTVWFGETWRRLLIALWSPCILYVVLLAGNMAATRPLAAGLRLLLWAAIIVLFVRSRPPAADPRTAQTAPQSDG